MGGRHPAHHRTAHQQKGDNLEERVATLLKRMGKWGVKRHVMLRDGFGNLSEIDVVYGIFRRRYIECKAYHKDHHVPLADVAKFKEVLRLNGISPRRGLFVTTSDYVPRARTTGIKVLNGTQLARLERLWPLYRLARILGTFIAGTGLLLLVDDYLETKPSSVESYAQKLRHFPYVKDLYGSSPSRLNRMAAQVREWCKKQLEKL